MREPQVNNVQLDYCQFIPIKTTVGGEGTGYLRCG